MFNYISDANKKSELIFNSTHAMEHGQIVDDCFSLQANLYDQNVFYSPLNLKNL